MNKPYLIFIILVVASAIFLLMPGVLENMSHFLHWLTIVVSGHHIAGEVARSIQPIPYNQRSER